MVADHAHAMSQRIDCRLGQVAALRQISVSTAQRWRDSKDRRWQRATREIRSWRYDRREMKRLGDCVPSTLDALRALPSNHYTCERGRETIARNLFEGARILRWERPPL